MGDDVIFNTSLAPTQTPFISIIWKIGTNNIITSHSGGNFTDPEYEGRITLFISTGSLELRNVALNDTGVYSVNIRQAGPQMPVSKVTVSVSNTDLVEFNSSVTLSCSASGSSLSFLWLNDSTEVTASDRVNLTDGGETLTITTVWRYDQGPFKCNVSNLVSSNISDPVKLSINLEGISLNLTCDASGSIVTREWTKNGLPLNPSANIFFSNEKQVLSFRALNRKDSGRYTCKTSNPISSQEATYFMVVTYGPENVKISGPTEVQVKTTLKLSCLAESLPAASYIWIKNGTTVASSFEYINNMTGFSDSGEYTCEATNDITMTTSEVTHISSSDLVEFNSSVTLSCSADGASLTTFLWLNGSTEVTATSDRVHLTDGGATLTITTVGRYDQGPFTCKVSNLVSSSISDPVQLSINYGPDGAILSISPLLDYYEEGSDVSLSCSADSRPAAQFKWLLNGTLLSFTGAQMELKTIQTSQSGNYSCQAFNNKTLRYTTSQPASISVLAAQESLSAGAIAGITVALLVVVAGAAAGGFHVYKHQ
uniref:Ig-like domain-containing protein n=1 Tax=Periophthalmus magnuspinnatus TaxID=409849 RepID=A0A3B4B4L1_9GOBI